MAYQKLVLHRSNCS